MQNKHHLFFLLLVSVCNCCLINECVDFNQNCVSSVETVKCKECDYLGYIKNNTCVYPPIVPQCAPGYCLQGDNICGLSFYGVLCSECGYKGYLLTNSTCVCYDGSIEPNCYRYITPTVLVKNITIVNNSMSTCVPFNSTTYGCYLLTTHRVPDKCCSDFIGPPVGSLYNDSFKMA